MSAAQQKIGNPNRASSFSDALNAHTTQLTLNVDTNENEMPLLDEGSVILGDDSLLIDSGTLDKSNETLLEFSDFSRQVSF